MIGQLKKSFLLLVSMLVFLPAQIALADTGPKPGMDFQFKQEMTGEQVKITSGIMYECQQADCSDAFPLEELGPQRFACEVNSCYAVAYGFRPYHRLEIQFSDGQTRQSNIFETAGFDSTYTVTVRPQDLLVEAKFSLGVFPPIATILVACVCALIGLGLLAGLIIFMRRRSSRN
jgi:hypothetical protein